MSKTGIQDKDVAEVRESAEPSFEELFEANPVTPDEDFSPGDTVSGEVVKISPEWLFVDLGGKSVGVVDPTEFFDPEGQLTVKIGDVLELRVASVAEAIILSKGLKVKGAEAIEMLHDAHQARLPVEGRVSGVNKGGFEIDISGVRAFCPMGQIDIAYCQTPETHIGARYTFRIQEFRDRGKSIVVSRRVLLEEDRARAAKELMGTLRVGQDREGAVTKLTAFGAFVDLGGGVEGMVHVSEMAHYRVKDPSEILRPGQPVTVRVVECEAGKEGRPRIALSLKALEQSPWDKGLPVQEGQVAAGKVTRVKEFGAFVELLPGIEGLVHVSEISYGRVSHPSKVLTEGQEVMVRVLSIDRDRRRISLSIKEAQSMAASTVAEVGDAAEARPPAGAGIVEGARLTGVVEKAGPGGLHMRLPGAGPGQKGFLPAEELGTAANEDLRKRFPAGTTLEVEVISVQDGKGVRLSRRAVTEGQERSEYRRYMDQGRKGAGLATLGDLFKDLKLPKR